MKTFFEKVRPNWNVTVNNEVFTYVKRKDGIVTLKDVTGMEKDFPMSDVIFETAFVSKNESVNGRFEKEVKKERKTKSKKIAVVVKEIINTYSSRVKAIEVISKVLNVNNTTAISYYQRVKSFGDICNYAKGKAKI